jgi:rubredoxin
MPFEAMHPSWRCTLCDFIVYENEKPDHCPACSSKAAQDHYANVKTDRWQPRSPRIDDFMPD